MHPVGRLELAGTPRLATISDRDCHCQACQCTIRSRGEQRITRDVLSPLDAARVLGAKTCTNRAILEDPHYKVPENLMLLEMGRLAQSRYWPAFGISPPRRAASRA
jgi:crotonobetainyl-CoA:carnitine CoA-transferase CaiB-like acyl-CoA transferase